MLKNEHSIAAVSGNQYHLRINCASARDTQERGQNRIVSQIKAPRRGKVASFRYTYWRTLSISDVHMKAGNVTLIP